MLRMLRITGILVFAILAGLSANRLFEMYETGELMQKYNTPRKTNTTLLLFSIMSLGTLGYFELSRGKRYERRRLYDKEDVSAPSSVSVDENKTSCIYSAPETQEAWMFGNKKGSKPRHRKKTKDFGGFWMGIIRVCCLILPLFYLIMGLVCQSKVNSENELSYIFPMLFLGMTLFSIFASFGLLKKRAWGIGLGYALSVFNLLVFPYGTAMGLFLLIGLVGASSEYEVSSNERRKKARSKAKRRAAQQQASSV